MKLNELKRLDAKATPGPWRDEQNAILDSNDAWIADAAFAHSGARNSALIAAARNALPALLAVAEAAKRLRDANDNDGSIAFNGAMEDLSVALHALEAQA